MEKQGSNAPLSVEQKRLRAIEYAFWAGKLLEPKYFDDASKALAKLDKDALFKVCLDAGIPQNVIEQALEDFTDAWGGGWGGGWAGGWQ